MDTLNEMYSSLQQIQLTGSNILQIIRRDPEYITLYDGIVENICSACFTAAEILTIYMDDEKSGLYTEKIALDLKYELHREEWQKWLSVYLAYENKDDLFPMENMIEPNEMLGCMREDGRIENIPEDDPEMLFRAWNDFVVNGEEKE